MALLFATSNTHKLKEVRNILNPLDISIVGLHDIGFDEEIEEYGKTLEENASIKANHMHTINGQDVFAEDTGLEVEALEGAPGVYTARFAGPQKNHDDNMNLLLDKLRTHTNRKARFKAVISLIYHGKEYQFVGIVSGSIASSKKGNGGFGYDPIFIPDGYSESFAELGDDIKSTLSHRARAVEKMLAFFEDQK